MNFGSHPLNLALRFLLEICSLIAVGYWAYQWEGSSLRYVYMILFPVFMAAIWGIFAVPNDPSRSGKTVVKTLGSIRLMLELGIFSSGTLALNFSHHHILALVFTVIVMVHYFVSLDRIKWLMKQ